MECSICGNEKEESMLFNAITKEGVVKVCRKCSIREEIPIVKERNVNQFKKREYPTTYERLSAMANLNPQEHKNRIKELSNFERQRQNQELRKFLGKKELSFPNLKQHQPDAKPDLIRNYHWTIFNARRARKLTQKQLAEEMTESESAIKLAEKGILPDNYAPLIKKFQVCLNVTLFNSSQQEQKQLGFDKFTSKGLTLSDLQEMGDKKEKDKSNSFFPYWKRKLANLQKRREKKKAVEKVEEPKSENDEHKQEPMILDSKDEEKTGKKYH